MDIDELTEKIFQQSFGTPSDVRSKVKQLLQPFFNEMEARTLRYAQEVAKAHEEVYEAKQQRDGALCQGRVVKHGDWGNCGSNETLQKKYDRLLDITISLIEELRQKEEK